MIISKSFAQSTTLLPNSVKIGNVTSLGTCNSTTRGVQVFNTSDGKMYFCNGTGWVDMAGGSGGSLTLPYSGSSSTSSTLFSLTNSGSGRGISVITGSNRAIYGESTGGAGVYGVSDSNAGLYGVSNTGVGVFGYANSDFSGYFNNKAKVGFNLAVGQLTYAQTIARLHIKADGNGGWGQHIRMENGNDNGYGEILHDSDGMKFRNFQANESFIFRNSANSTVFTINSSGNTSATGNIYADGNAIISGGAAIGTDLSIGDDVIIYGKASVSGKVTAEGQGIVLNNTASTYIIRHETEGYSFSNLAAGATIISTLGYSGFSGVPMVSVAQVESGAGSWDKILVVPYNVTATSCSLRFTNVSNSSISASGTWHFTIIGPK
ncbi:hypothetical protein [Emticicia sp. BO119]|uniref:hypothetical protein n=1 Tax=Emticicia sp. BO119 TaxID=2757768 RepID=UPI0015F084D3|nr:hypothetical protein [Emticicia sp. BO119]MBA4850606.1 hypothetical protein [Emticicia sp. BO119]